MVGQKAWGLGGDDHAPSISVLDCALTIEDQECKIDV